jgi:hypothetical protein
MCNEHKCGKEHTCNMRQYIEFSDKFTSCLEDLAKIRRDILSKCICFDGLSKRKHMHAVKKFKNQNIQDDNFACHSVWV